MSERLWLRESAVLIAQETSIAIHGGSPGIRERGLLDSALARPRNLYEYEDADLCALAAAYTAGIVRNHPFVDGNKRAGFLAGAAFLELNGMTFSASEADATQVILGLAAGKLTEPQLADFFRRSCKGPE